MATTFTVLTSAFNDGATDTPAAARAQYYTNWTQINKITDEGTADSVVKTDSNGNINLKNTISGYTTTATAGGTTTLTVSSTHTQRFTGTSSQTVVLPVTSTLTLNQEYEIVNDSTGAITVQSSGTDEITKVNPDESAIIKCIALTGTDETSWTYSKTSKDGTTTTHTQSTSINELPAGSLDGNITDWSYEGLTLVNSIENGDFSDGTTGWTALDSTLSESSNVLSIIGDGGASNVRAYISSGLTTTDKYFYYIKARVTNSSCQLISLSIFTTGTKFVDSVATPTQNTWYELYGTKTETDTITRLPQIYHTYADAITANGKVMQVDGTAGVFAINMTALGIESYTEAQMLDLCRGGYFEGMANTKNPLITTKNSDETVDSQLQAEVELPGFGGVYNKIYQSNEQVYYQNYFSDYTAIATATAINTTNYPLAKSDGVFYLIQDDGTVVGGVVDGTTTTTDAGDFYYELATPDDPVNLTSELKVSGLLQSYEDGTMYLESGYRKAHIAVSNDITLDSALSEITSIKELDETGNEINVLTTDDYDAFTAGDTTVTNLPSATATYLVEGLLMYNITGTFEGEIPTNTGARIDSAIQGTNTNSKSISNLNDAVQLLIASL